MKPSAAGVLFLRKENNQLQVLLGKRNVLPGRGLWSIPGGSVDHKDKSLKETALREAKEEVPGLKKIKGRGTKGYIYGYEDWSFLSFSFRTYFVFLKRKYARSKLKHNYEFSQLKWFSLDELPSIMQPGLRSKIRASVEKLKEKEKPNWK